MFEEAPKALAPINFFQISADCFGLKEGEVNPFPSLNSKNVSYYLLPNTASFCHQDSFADVALGWSREGVEALVHVKRPYHVSCYPEVASGDSVELFIDTRDVKTSGYNTRFCHHFFFLPEAVKGHQAGEITRFRTEDTHELCDPSELKVKAQIKDTGYVLNIFIPSQCMQGYDPDQFDRLGFTYRINRSIGEPQHFSVTTEDYQLEQQPSLWSSLRLVK